MPGSLRRLLHALTALGLLTAVGAGLFFVSWRAGRVEPLLRVEFGEGSPPGVVVLEAAGDPGPDPFTAPVAVDLGVALALLPLPPDDPAALASPHHRHSSADLAAAGPFGYELVRRRDRTRGLTVAAISAVARQVLGPAAALSSLEDGDGDGRDDDGRFTLTAADGSAACVTVGPPRLVALALGLQVDPADGRPGSTPGAYGAAASGEVCDVPLLVGRLAANPPVAEAWALVHGITVPGIEGFAAGLTPVILLGDTLVTDHGYDSGKILPRRAVLQRGTAVLVDGRGRPAVRCLSGSPLLAAPSLSGEVEARGAAWPGFAAGRVGEVVPADREVAEFLL
ncbi:MAG: hypothetical protein H6Q11_1448, partial [Acidobacteria bacterium]|nr:hypothetical protein [Acidobacteriota bacterium]